jgi:site-specific DNA recombinase
MLRMLRSPALKGVAMHYVKKGANWQLPVPLLGRNGMPVRREALIDDDKWDELQERIGKPQDRSHYRTNAATLLLGVAHCGECGGAMHSERKTGRDKVKQRRYYGCQQRHYGGCTARLIPMDELDEAVNEAILAVGHLPDFDTKRGKSSNTREHRLKDIGEAIVNLTQERYVQNIIRPDYDAMIASLQAQRERVQLEPEPEPKPVVVKTGKTIEQTWNERDDEGKRRWLLRRGIKVNATRAPAPDDFVSVQIDGGEFTENLEALGYPMREALRELSELRQRLTAIP